MAVQAAVKALIAVALGVAPLAVAADLLPQATVKDDGVWRAAVGASYAASSGNTRSTTLSGMADAVRATASDKTALYASALYGSSQGNRTATLLRLGAKQDWNLSPQLYVFGLLEGERDELAGLQSRSTLGGGIGWKFFDTDALKFEVFGGTTYVADRFDGPRLIDGEERSSYGHATMLAGEESVHKFGQNATARQRFTIFPDLSHQGEYRLTWDAVVAVPATAAISLTAGVNVKHNSDPGSAVKKTDTLFTTGISIKFD